MPMLKEAALGSATEKQIELTFAASAYSTYRDRMPLLIEHLRGFELLEKSEDNSKAAGVFGAKINSQWFYLPCMFVRKELKGSELLFVQNMFAELSEPWVNYFLSKGGPPLGSGHSFLRARSRDAADPRPLDVIYGRKQGSSRDLGPVLSDPAFRRIFSQRFAKEALAEDGPDFFAFVASVAQEKPLIKRAAAVRHLLHPSRAIEAGGVSLESVLESSPSAFRKVAGLAAARPAVESWMRRRMGVEWRGKLASIHAPATVRIEFPSTPSRAAFRADERLDPSLTGALRFFRKQGDKIAVSPGVRPADLTDEIRELLLHSPWVVADDRTEKQASAVVVDASKKVQNPTDDGTYQVMTLRGPRRCHVLSSPRRDSELQGAVFVIDAESKEYCIVGRSAVWVLDDPEENRKALYDSLSSEIPPKPPKPKKSDDPCCHPGPGGEDVTFLGVTESDTFGPYRRWSGEEGDAEGEAIPVWSTYEWFDEKAGPRRPGTSNPKHMKRRRDAVKDLGLQFGLHRDWTWEQGVTGGARDQESIRFLVPTEDSAIEVVGDCLRVPSNSKYLKLGKSGLALTTSAVHSLLKNASEEAVLEVRPHGDGFLRVTARGVVTFDGPDGDAVFHLMGKHAFAATDADQAVRTAIEQKRTVDVLVRYPEWLRGRDKTAFSGPPPTAPGFPEDPLSAMTVGRESVLYSPNTSHALEVDSLERRFSPAMDWRQNGRAEDYSLVGQDPMMEAMMGQGQQSEVSEMMAGTRMLTMLLNSTSIDREIKSSAKAFMGGMNQAGRLYYSMLWHYDDYEEAFGVESMPELEDGLVNALKANGAAALKVSENLQTERLDQLLDIDLSTAIDQ